MIQETLWETEKLVNVGTVPQRSPFRYPGGKTWLVPRIRQWLYSLSRQPDVFIEPFAGGGIAGLTVAAEGLANHVMMVELDEDVAAVWHTIINEEDGGEWLAHRIVSFTLNPDTVKEVLGNTGLSAREVAFQTIVRNRVNRGGILAPGAGILRAGENGKGLLSRWYPETLKKRILDIVKFRDRITFVHGDGLSIIEQYRHQKKVAYFVDPPYTASRKKAGSRLYKYHRIDHDRLFNIVSDVKGDFLMTYDNAEEVQYLAERHQFASKAVAMKNTHHATMQELLIGRSFDWL